jgi:hypothetical protein
MESKELEKNVVANERKRAKERAATEPSTKKNPKKPGVLKLPSQG